MKARFSATITWPLSPGSKVKVSRNFTGTITAKAGADLLNAVAGALTAIVAQQDVGEVNALTVRASIRR